MESKDTIRPIGDVKRNRCEDVLDNIQNRPFYVLVNISECHVLVERFYLKNEARLANEVEKIHERDFRKEKVGFQVVFDEVKHQNGLTRS